VKTREGDLVIAVLVRQGDKALELQEINSDAERTLPRADVLWLARIVWLTQ
jgi:hypothetical protein